MDDRLGVVVRACLWGSQRCSVSFCLRSRHEHALFYWGGQLCSILLSACGVPVCVSRQFPVFFNLLPVCLPQARLLTGTFSLLFLFGDFVILPTINVCLHGQAGLPVSAFPTTTRTSTW